MKQTCNNEYWEFIGWSFKSDKNPPCGKTYDDYDCSTQCPHDPLGPELTDAQLDELYKQVIEPAARVTMGPVSKTLTRTTEEIVDAVRNMQKRTK